MIVYVAKAPFKYKRLSDGNLIFIKPGDEVTDFSQWQYIAKLAFLNIEWIEKVERPDLIEDNGTIQYPAAFDMKEKVKGRHSKHK